VQIQHAGVPIITGAEVLNFSGTSIGDISENGTGGVDIVLTPGPIFISNRTISSSVTIAAGQNALSVGPVQIAPGVTLTLAPGSMRRVL
jgi:hypothetical protein